MDGARLRLCSSTGVAQGLPRRLLPLQRPPWYEVWTQCVLPSSNQEVSLEELSLYCVCVFSFVSWFVALNRIVFGFSRPDRPVFGFLPCPNFWHTWNLRFFRWNYRLCVPHLLCSCVKDVHTDKNNRVRRANRWNAEADQTPNSKLHEIKEKNKLSGGIQEWTASTVTKHLSKTDTNHFKCAEQRGAHVAVRLHTLTFSCHADSQRTGQEKQSPPSGRPQPREFNCNQQSTCSVANRSGQGHCRENSKVPGREKATGRKPDRTLTERGESYKNIDPNSVRTACTFQSHRDAGMQNMRTASVGENKDVRAH